MKPARGAIGERKSMNCAEFQKVLPYIIETGGNAEEEAHLSACSVCSDLVTDLRYIAEQAKLLLPMHDPSPKVWDNIQGSLEREGLVKPGRARGRLLGSSAKNTNFAWVAAAAAAAVLLIVGLFLYSRGWLSSRGLNLSAGSSSRFWVVLRPIQPNDAKHLGFQSLIG
jgi:hypothetical protein